MADDFSELAKRALCDIGAGNALLDRMLKTANPIITRYGLDNHADEVQSHVLLDAWRGLFDENGAVCVRSPDAWIGTITIRRCCGFLRKLYRKNKADALDRARSLPMDDALLPVFKATAQESLESTLRANNG
jgi:DNA-directed RNA polymerase specialized sigma24 family protein